MAGTLGASVVGAAARVTGPLVIQALSAFGTIIAKALANKNIDEVVADLNHYSKKEDTTSLDVLNCQDLFKQYKNIKELIQILQNQSKPHIEEAVQNAITVLSLKNSDILKHCYQEFSPEKLALKRKEIDDSSDFEPEIKKEKLKRIEEDAYYFNELRKELSEPFLPEFHSKNTTEKPSPSGKTKKPRP